MGESWFEEGDNFFVREFDDRVICLRPSSIDYIRVSKEKSQFELYSIVIWFNSGKDSLSISYDTYDEAKEDFDRILKLMKN